MANNLKIQEVMDYITENPMLHDQATWIRRVQPCGTAACIAGWAAILAGWTPVFINSDGSLSEQPTSSSQLDTASVTKGDRVDLIDTVATEVLGLDADESQQLFYGGNTTDDLWRIVEVVTGGAVRHAS